MKPFLDSNGKNLSLALRQLIEYYRQEANFNKESSDQKRKMTLRNQVIESRIAVLIPIPLFKWLRKRNLCVPPPGIFRSLIEKYTRLIGVKSLTFEDYVKMVNTHGDVFGYQISQHIEVMQESKNIRIMFEAEDSDHLIGTVIDYSCMLAHHPFKMKTKKVIESPNLIIVEYEHCSDESDAYMSIVDHFGRNQLIFDEIEKNIEFWRILVYILKADHYEDVVISRGIFLQLLNSRDFSDHLTHLISIIYSVSVEDTDYQHIIRFIEEVCKANGLVHKVEYDDNEIRIYHTFDDKNIIQVVNNTIIKILGKADQHFMLKKGEKMTILNRM